MPRSSQGPTAVEDALEALYAAFCRYQGTHLEGCPHCVSFEDSAALRRAPLRQLGGELQRYLFKAMTTWGTEEDFKHFAPRLIELYASSTDAWLLCDKLAYARWRSWPQLEQRAVEHYLLMLWRDELAKYGPPLPGNALLETMVTLDLDIAPYDLRTKLEAWRLDSSPESALHIAHFVLEHGQALFWPSVFNGRLTLWQAKPEIADDVREWLLEPATRERLEASFVVHGDVDVARAFDFLEMAAQSER
jgi:hypothetical protein